MNPDQIQPTYFIPASDWFDEEYFGKFMGKNDYLNQKRLLNEKRYRIENIDFSYRIINYWQELGLIDEDRPKGKGWRKYSFTDIVWLHIISQLRLFGFPIEKIKKIKEDILLYKDYALISKMPLLDFYILYAINMKRPTYLIACNNGQCFILSQKELSMAEAFGNIKNYITININKILQLLISKIDIRPDYFSSVELKDDEISLIYALRFENIESISIRLENSKIAVIEKTFIENNQERLVDLLRRKDFQDLDIKVRDGKIVRIQRKELIRPEKGTKSRLTQ